MADGDMIAWVQSRPVMILKIKDTGQTRAGAQQQRDGPRLNAVNLSKSLAQANGRSFNL